MKTKEEWRIYYKNLRQALDEQTRIERSEKLCDMFFENVNLSDARFIHCYLPIEKQCEPNTKLILEKLATDFQEIICSVPWVNPNGNDMESVVFTKDSQTIHSSFGIEVPEIKNIIPSEKIDIIILPLLAVDEAGYRIGYGKGFYDRYLTRCKPDVLKVAMSMFPSLAANSFQPDSWDIPADLVLAIHQ